MPDKTMDLKQAAADLVAEIVGDGAEAAASALHVPDPIAAMVGELGEQKAAEAIEWLLVQAERALRARLWPDAIAVQASKVEWHDSRQVVVSLSGQPRFVTPGPHLVQQLKARLQVPHDMMLVQVLHRPIADGSRSVLELADDATLTVRGEEIFEARARA